MKYVVGENAVAMDHGTPYTAFNIFAARSTDIFNAGSGNF